MSFLRQLTGAAPADHVTFLDYLWDPYVFIPLVLVSAVPIYQALITISTPKPLKGIPHLSKQAPILGDAVEIGKHIKKFQNFTGYFDTVVERLGNQGDGGICQVVVGFGRSGKMVVVSDVQEAEDILTKRTNEFDRSSDTIAVFSLLLPNGQIAMPTDLKWKHHRRLVGPSMTSKNLNMFTPRAVNTISKLIELWQLKSERLGEDGYFDCVEDFARATMDAICEITFGESYQCLEMALDTVKNMPREITKRELDGSVEFPCELPAIYTATQELSASLPILAIIPKLTFFFTSLTSKYRSAYKIVNGFLNRKIREGRTRAIERGQDKAESVDCVLDLVCLKESGSDKLDDESMRDELHQFLIAGQETTATTLTWTMIFLAQNPDVQRKLHKELVELGLGERVPGFYDVQADKAPYLEAVVYESLRLAGTAGGVTRRAVTDTTILGHFIPRDTIVYVPLTTIQSYSGYQAKNDAVRSESSKDIKAWNAGDISKFVPERWIVDCEFDVRAGPWMPFSAGARGCMGKPLALLELKLFVSQINMAFFLGPIPEDKQPMGYVETVTRRPIVSMVRPVPW